MSTIDYHIAALRKKYLHLKKECDHDHSSSEAERAVHELTVLALEFLANECTTVALTSRVPGKQYLSFVHKDAPALLSRPVNADIFTDDIELDTHGKVNIVGIFYAQ